jgi:hypothetical protein
MIKVISPTFTAIISWFGINPFLGLLSIDVCCVRDIQSTSSLGTPEGLSATFSSELPSATYVEVPSEKLRAFWGAEVRDVSREDVNESRA